MPLRKKGQSVIFIVASAVFPLVRGIRKEKKKGRRGRKKEEGKRKQGERSQMKNFPFLREYKKNEFSQRI